MEEFQGRIGKDWRSSEPWWPPQPKPKVGTPNVVLIVLDDVGFAQLGCYGSNIATPRIDALADKGVRLANFHTTSLCSPTRACLLTGRNHHRSGMGRVADLAIGFPGYYGKPPKENGFLSEVLRNVGFATYAVGKWHLTPDDETHMAASRSSWPLGRGFDRWYGFHGGETSQFYPALYHDNHSIRPPRSYAEGYHLTEDLTDHAIEFIADLRAVEVDRPFFLYFCPGACHSPHQPPVRWAHRYRGAFDDGWDRWREQTFDRQVAMGLLPEATVLSPRPDWVRSFGELNQEESALAARFMEKFASFLSDTDAQIGRLLDFLDDLGELANTIVVLVSDNGASAEGGPEGSINDVRLANLDPATTSEMYARIDEIGGPTSHNNYPWGWTMAGNTPFRRWKREVHEGGVADPCIVTWPKGSLAIGEIRHQYAHAIDVRGTILQLLGVAEPSHLDYVPQTSVDSASFASILAPHAASAPATRTTQYYEMFGSRALYHEGWKAVTFHPIAPLYDDKNPNDDFDEDQWELYDVTHDLTETRDLASEYPELLESMKERWWREAEQNQVLPLDNRVLWALVHPKPDQRGPVDTMRYFQGASQVPEPVAIDLKYRSHRLFVDFTLEPGDPPAGVLLAQGSALGGWSLYLLDGFVHYSLNLYGKSITTLKSSSPVTAGSHSVLFSFTKDERDGGDALLQLDGSADVSLHFDRVPPAGWNGVGAGLTCGYEWGPSVGQGYAAPFSFPGSIHQARIEALGPKVRDPLAEIEAILSQQ
ncbi:arylsulfatase [Ferrimicrobium sp.]|uniref:arylsulfatase n=1 Tax=Ferrimicrobium sp. TaxID=2926050 RepID=UPI0026112E14|nr:arylsulfatase [Ferrimicrobium sp.]